MNRNIKLGGALFLVLLGLGGLATWDEWKTKKDEKEKETKGQLLQINPDAVTALRLQSAPETSEGGKSASTQTEKPLDVSLKLENDVWKILSPIQAEADQQVVKDLIKSVAEYKTESEVAQGKNSWQQYGLTSPRRIVDLSFSDGKQISFLVGINSPVGFSSYVATSQTEAVYVGSQYISTSTGKSLFDLRNKKITHLMSGDITEMSGGKKGTKTVLQKTENKWNITSPVSTLADQVAVSNLLDDLLGLKATEFFDTPDKRLESSLNTTKDVLIWQLKTPKESLELQIFGASGAYYVRLGGSKVIYKISEDIKNKVLKSAEDLRDKRIFSFESAQISQIEIDGQTYKKISNDWYPLEKSSLFKEDGSFPGKPEDRPAPATNIRGLIVDLEYSKAEDIFDGQHQITKKLPPAPLHKISMKSLDNSNPLELHIQIWQAAENPDSVYIRHNGSSSTFKAKRSLMANMNAAEIKPVGNELMPSTME